MSASAAKLCSLIQAANFLSHVLAAYFIIPVIVREIALPDAYPCHQDIVQHTPIPSYLYFDGKNKLTPIHAYIQILCDTKYLICRDIASLYFNNEFLLAKNYIEADSKRDT